MLPRGDRAYREEEKRRFSRYPWLAKLYRWLLWASLELRWPLFRGNRFLAKRVEAIALRHLNEVVGDPALRAALVPDYPLGGKRILVSDDYYETLTREDVELVTADIEHLNEDGVVTRDGANRPVDVVILATGFETTAFLAPMRLEGIGGHCAARDWEDGARSFLGISSAGYPNFFMMYGPNTNLGHNSIIFMIECQAAYIVQCIRRLIDRDVAWLDVHPGVQAAYDADIQADLQRTVWAAPDRSWYKNAAGRITNNWAGSTLAYWWRTRTVDFSLYREVPRAELPPYRGAAPDSAAA
jgi:cation diffusion facilitator CzcD-associated flavoprotein CzcO